MKVTGLISQSNGLVATFDDDSVVSLSYVVENGALRVEGDITSTQRAVLAAFMAGHIGGDVKQLDSKYNSGGSTGVAIISSNYNIKVTDHLIVVVLPGGDNTTTVTLPDPSEMVGRELVFKRTDGNWESQLSIVGSINGNEEDNFGLSPYIVFTMISDGTTWQICFFYNWD